MAQPKTQYLPGLEGLKDKTFGGPQTVKGNPREKRPISTKKPMHLTLRSRFANGERSFLERERSLKIDAVIHRAAKTHGVQIFRIANAGNHLHLAILPRSRRAFIAFVRVISGLIARITLGRERGAAGEAKFKKIKSFWDARPYTRILEWGREFTSVKKYIVQNSMEASGFIAYRERRKPPRLSTA